MIAGTVKHLILNIPLFGLFLQALRWPERWRTKAAEDASYAAFIKAIGGKENFPDDSIKFLKISIVFEIAGHLIGVLTLMLLLMYASGCVLALAIGWLVAAMCNWLLPYGADKLVHIYMAKSIDTMLDEEFPDQDNAVQ